MQWSYISLNIPFPNDISSIYILREAGWLLPPPSSNDQTHISIHALREAGRLVNHTFWSAWNISIHALHEAGRLFSIVTRSSSFYFNPRPARSRATTSRSPIHSLIPDFNPRPARSRATANSTKLPLIFSIISIVFLVKFISIHFFTTHFCFPKQHFMHFYRCESSGIFMCTSYSHLQPYHNISLCFSKSSYLSCLFPDMN